MKLILLGNAGAGKTTMARRIIGDEPIPRLSLDEIAWDDGPNRKPLEVSLRMLHAFIQSNEQWIVEGCYSDLIQAALPYCTELRFLNPGIEVCVAHCHRRPWEPEKFSSPEDQAGHADSTGSVGQGVRDPRGSVRFEAASSGFRAIRGSKARIHIC